LLRAEKPAYVFCEGDIVWVMNESLIAQHVFHDTCCGLLHSRYCVIVGVKRDSDVRVPQHLGDDLGVGTPFASSSVAQVCLRSWKRMSGRPARRTRGLKCREHRFSPGSAYRLTSSPTTTDMTSSLMSKLA